MALSPHPPFVSSLSDMASDLNRPSPVAPHSVDSVDLVVSDPSRPRWENMHESPTIEQISSKYKLKLKYGGFFRSIKNSCRKRYCFGSQKSIYMDSCSYNLNELIDEVMKHYPSRSDLVFTSLFVDKYANQQSFIELDSDDIFKAMLSMYDEEKEVTIYVRAEKNIDTNGLLQSEQDEVFNETRREDDSDYCPSEESYHSRYSSDSENELPIYEGETYEDCKKSSTIEVNSKFPNVVAFRRALNHHALMNEFEYFIEKSEPTRFTARCASRDCEWRIHASILQDGVTFEVRKLIDKHSCIRSNKCGNKFATQGWIADVVVDKLKSDGDVSVAELKKWLMKNYNVDVPYMRVFRGKEQAYTDIYGKWDDSFMKMDDFKDELQRRNPESIVDIDFETKDGKKHFQRFFISLAACSKGFLLGCRPYLGLDACHLKGKFNGVLAAATGIDGNNCMYPIAYGVLESENTESWTWFLRALQRAIGTPYGLVISSDMQKGLEAAIGLVYPSVEHRECMRHLYSNFKKQFRGDFFRNNMWDAAKTYCLSEHDRLLDEIAKKRADAITFLNENHKKIWSRSKFGTAAKCDYITNNISETFNSWIGEVRYQPVLDLLDAIRERIMVLFDKKRRIVKKWKGMLVPTAKDYLNKITKNLGAYEVCRSSDNRAEVKCKGKRWEVILDEKKCSCRVWQVRGLPCVHAAAFIAFTRDANWEKYADLYFTIEKCKAAYAMEIAPMPGKDQWVHVGTEEKIYPPTIKRPPGRPKKGRYVPSDEPKRKHKCRRCGMYGHHQKTCKNPEPLMTASQVSESGYSQNTSQPSTSKRAQGKNSQARRSKKSKPCDAMS